MRWHACGSWSVSDGATGKPDKGAKLVQPCSISPLLAEIESPNAFRIIGTLQHLGMLEAAYDIVVTGPPMLLHGTTRKLVVLRSSFIAPGVINELNNVINLFIGFLGKNLDLGHCSQVIRKMCKDSSKCSAKHLRILELVGRSAGPT